MTCKKCEFQKQYIGVAHILSIFIIITTFFIGFMVGMIWMGK